MRSVALSSESAGPFALGADIHLRAILDDACLYDGLLVRSGDLYPAMEEVNEDLLTCDWQNHDRAGDCRV